MTNSTTHTETNNKEIVCDSCGHAEEIEIDHSSMDSLLEASKQINKLFRVKRDTHICNAHCKDVSFNSLDQSF